MRNNTWIKLFFLILLVVGVNATMGIRPVFASSVTPPLLRIFYFKDNTSGRNSLFTHAASIDVLAPQAYSLNSSGVLFGSISPDILAFTQRNNIKVMPLVTNKAFSKTIAATILANPAVQNVALNELVNEAKSDHYWGWQFDFEQMDAGSADAYSAFVKKAGALFKKNNLEFSVAVIAQISNNPADYKPNLWENVIGVYDYAALAPSVNFVSVMSYDDPDSKGAVAPYTWMQKVVQYSLQYIPANKISLGIPLYYWKWDDTSGKLVDVGGYSGIKTAMQKRNVKFVYNTTEQTQIMEYTYKNNHYSIWYDNGTSLTQKINLIKQYKLQGFSAWVLGLETPSVYSAF